MNYEIQFKPEDEQLVCEWIEKNGYTIVDISDYGDIMIITIDTYGDYPVAPINIDMIIN